MKKNGMTLVVLTITIIVLALLVGMVVTGTSVATSNAKMQTLANELVQIEEVINNAVALDTELPIKDGSVEHTTASLKTLVGTEYETTLENEIKANGDQDSKFRVIDMAKIGASVTTKGTAKESGADIFVFAVPSYNVYYVKGVHVGGQSYYSLTDGLSELVKVNKNVNVPTTDPEINVTVSRTYKAKLVTKEKAKELNIEITAPNASSLAIDLILKDSGVEKTINIKPYIVDGVFTYKVNPAAGITASMVKENPTIKIQFKGTAEGAAVDYETQINVSNIDITSPSAPVYVNTQVAGVNNIVNVSAPDSDVKYFVYEYYSKIASNSVEKTIYTTNATTEEQKRAGLLAGGLKSEDGVIKLPRYISKILVMAVDEAGNTSPISTISADSAFLIAEL